MSFAAVPEVTIRHAEERDLRFISTLAADPMVEPFLMPRAADSDRLRELLNQTPLGLFVIEAGDLGRAGALVLELVSERSRLCQLSRLMVDPARRGRGIATEAVRQASRLALVDLGAHRVQAEVYGDNALSLHLFERVGFTREGVRRRAYWRRGQWLDGVLYGLLAEDLAGRGMAQPSRAEPIRSRSGGKRRDGKASAIEDLTGLPGESVSDHEGRKIEEQADKTNASREDQARDGEAS